MKRLVCSWLKNILWHSLPVDREAKEVVYHERRIVKNAEHADEEHLAETAKWLCRAQDRSASQDGGVARAFKAAKYQGYGSYGWQPSYPETTGYIIPTMLALGDYFSNDEFYRRANTMAEWESSIQLPSGAVMGSVLGAPVSPAVFNTGQVIFGWLAAFKNTKKETYSKSAVKAGDYLLTVQGSDGLFQRGDSQFAMKNATTYNARVAWALITLGMTMGVNRYIEAGRKTIDTTLERQNKKGWFSNNCLNDPEKPLLHTIAYTIRGILEAGILLDESRYIDAACVALNALLQCQHSDGGIPGRLNAEWKPEAEWDCITGDSQSAIAWLRAYKATGNRQYEEAARRVIRFVKKTQRLDHSNPGIRGGIKGSFPFDGPYGQYEFLNWGAKFFCDLLLMVHDDRFVEEGIVG